MGLLAALQAPAQSHPYPGKETPVLCTGCDVPNKDLPTWPYDDPLVRHTGRYVDSVTTMNVQNVGMRTVRAQKVRLSPAQRRLYVELGETVAAFSLDRFFQTTLAEPMSRVSVMKTGTTYGRYGKPLEKVAKPEMFFYAEATQSGWRISEGLDTQEVLTGWDVDDRGYVYAGTISWGWGIARDTGQTNCSHMEFVIRVTNSSFGPDMPVTPDALVALKSNGSYYLVVSQNKTSNAGHLVYGVDDPAAPVKLLQHQGPEHGIIHFARDDARERLAVIGSDGHLRLFDYAAFVTGGEPLFHSAPLAGHSFKDLTFDERGHLWVAESSSTLVSSNRLWELVPNGRESTPVLHAVYGLAFIPDKIAAGWGYVAVGGKGAGNKTELRLFHIVGGVPRLLDTGDFFRRYYHDVIPEYASAASYTQSYHALAALELVREAGKVYLMYSATGLGDVYELPNVIPTAVALTAPSSTSQVGEPVTYTATLRPESLDAAPPAGDITFTRNGVPVAAMPMTAAGDGTFTAAVTLADLLPGSFAVGASYAGDVLYIGSDSATRTHEVAQVTVPALEAIHAGNAIRVTWPALAGIQYDVARQSASGPVFTRVTGGEYVDTTVAPGAVYLYRVNAVYTDTLFGPLSPTALASTITFTDPDLPAGTTVKAAHILELHAAVNALREIAGLPAAAFSTVAAGSLITAADVSQLRAAADQARVLLGLAPVFALPVAPGVTVRRDDVLGLRGAVE
jgi:hypothetical protein